MAPVVTHTCSIEKKKMPVLIQNVLGEAVKGINFVKSWFLKDIFTPYDEIENTYKVLLLHID